MVVIRPRSMPNASLRTLASGARQLVVQEALLMIVCEPSYSSSLTPMTIVMSSSVAGAEMMTFLAPPASTCFRASAAFVKKPVDSTTTSTPRSPHGRAAGSRSDSTFMVFPAILMPSPSAATSSSSLPSTLSYFSRWASTSGLVRSFTATISMSWPLAAAARQKLRPMRPNPLMPTRTVIADLPLTDEALASPTAHGRAAALTETLSVPAGCRRHRQSLRQGYREPVLRRHRSPLLYCASMSSVTTVFTTSAAPSSPVACALLREHVVGDDCVHHLSSSVVTGRLCTTARA